MDASDVLERLTALGVKVMPTPRGTLYLEPASLIPPDLLDQVRLHKAEVLSHLRCRAEPASPPDYAATACVCPVSIGPTGSARCPVCELPLICPGCGRCRGCKLRLRFPPRGGPYG